MKSAFSLLILSFLLFSCSAKKKEVVDLSEESGMELTDAVEVAEDVVSSDDDLFEDEPNGVAVEDATNRVENGAVIIEENPLYEVKKNETLMIIAFNLYGDYRRWKELRDMNPEVLRGSSDVHPGMNIKYAIPEKTFEYQAEGNPYLILKGDTLGIISTATYGTVKYWKNIWNNNKVLIRDPNRIYAGFTIYTPELAVQTVAARTK